MRLSGAGIDSFLKRPNPSVRAVLVYGPNLGLVRERAEALAQKVVPESGDPFRTSELKGSTLTEDPARLADEAAALSLTGGRRVVRVRDAADAQAERFREFLNDPPGEALVLVEAGNLGKNSSLRQLFESAANAASLPCYADEGRNLEKLIIETLARSGLRIEAHALEYLVGTLGEDRVLIRGELEKLAIYMGEDGKGEKRTITFSDALACVGDSGTLSLEEIGLATAGGDLKSLERQLARAFLESIAPVTVLRAVGRHLQRLQLVLGRIAGGEAEEQAIGALRPRLFFKTAPAFRRQLKLWNPARLGEAIARLTQAEIDCKTTGLPDRALCGRALMEIAQRAAP